MSTAIEIAYVEKLEQERDPLVNKARALVIVDQKSYIEAGMLLTGLIKPMIKEIHKSCDPVCEATNAAHKAATGQRKKLLDPILEAEEIIKDKIGDHQEKVEQERLQELWRIKEEQNRLAAEAGAKREAAERKAQEEADAKALEEAAALEAEGKHEEAEAVIAEPVPVYVPEEPVAPPPVAAAPLKKVKGMSSRKTYEGDVHDFGALLKGVLDGKIPRIVLKIDQGALNKAINSLGGQVDYPGVRVTTKRIVSGRASS